jgi:hypothetical protein
VVISYKSRASSIGEPKVFGEIDVGFFELFECDVLVVMPWRKQESIVAILLET